MIERLRSGRRIWLMGLDGAALSAVATRVPRCTASGVVTEHVGGFVVEGGPDSLITFKPQAVALASELGLAPRLTPAVEATSGSYVVRDGLLLRMPDGLAGFVPRRLGPVVTSPLLSPSAKLRMALEYAVPARTDETDESLEAFVTRRLGG